MPSATAERQGRSPLDEMSSDRTRLLVGDSPTAHRVARTLRDHGIEVTHLLTPNDVDLRHALDADPRSIAIVVHDDIRAVRYALACSHMAPHASILVTIFDRTIGDEIRRLVDNCEVTSPAELALPYLVDLCLNRSVMSRRRASTIRRMFGTLLTHLTGFLRTTDNGARIMVVGLIGMAAAVLLEFGLLATAHRRPVPSALFDAVRIVTAVGPAETPEGGMRAVISATLMLLTVILTAMFTAGVVDRSIGPRLLGLLGPRSIPRHGHVIVVGVGQVGARLCIELRARGIPVLAVERDPAAPGLRVIHHLRIPTIVGHGIDRALLEKARLRRASAIAAVGSSERDNLAVAVAAHGVASDVRIVLRAGDQEKGAETQALLPLGAVCDVTEVAASHVISRIHDETSSV